MASKRELSLWKRLLGVKVESFTEDGKFYTVAAGEKGLECDCQDFIFRRGSYRIVFQDPQKPQGLQGNNIQGCKHMAQYLADVGMKGVTKTGASCFHEKVEPRKSQ
jgi:hypothetical protein